MCNYCRDERSNPLSSNSESFKYKTIITGNTYDVGDGEKGYDANKVDKNETEIVVPLKHLNTYDVGDGEKSYDANKLTKMKLKLLYH